MKDTPDKLGGRETEPHVLWESASGEQHQAILLRLDRFAVAFRILGSVTVVRASEALVNFRVFSRDRLTYSGRAVVSSVVDTGTGTVCECMLGDPWMDVPVDSLSTNGTGLCAEFGHLIEMWQKKYRLTPAYKVAIADLESFLFDLRIWLEQVELGIRASPSDDRNRLEQEVIEKVGQSAVSTIRGLFDQFEDAAGRINGDSQPAHRAFGKRQLHPLLLCSPFVYRTFSKPLGYAGDYEMVNMMFRDPKQGSTLFAKIVNLYALRLPPIEAHRNRIVYLTERLMEESLRAVRQSKPLKVLSLGCGPAHEIQAFLTRSSLADQAEITLIDLSEEALQHTEGVLRAMLERFGRRTAIRMQKKSVLQLIRESSRSVYGDNAKGYDFVYCGGLFDYLADNICAKLIEILYSLVLPGGLLAVTNVDSNPSRGEMEHFLDWHLIYRNAAHLARLAPGSVPKEQVSVIQDPTGVNLFMEIRKPAGTNEHERKQP